jgi:hypothetical protein
MKKERELLPGQQNVDLGCSVGRGLSREQRLGGLDWATPCPLPARHSVWLTDLKVLMGLCDDHNRVLAELGLTF